MKTTQQLATEMGVSIRTVARLACAAGIAKRYGNVFVFDAEEEALIRSLCRGKVGNPNFSQGNYYRQLKKKTKKRKAKKS